MLIVTLRQLELADFADSNVIKRRKYAELCALSLKSYEMKIRLSADSELKCNVKCLLKNRKIFLHGLGSAY